MVIRPYKSRFIMLLKFVLEAKRARISTSITLFKSFMKESFKRGQFYKAQTNSIKFYESDHCTPRVENSRVCSVVFVRNRSSGS